MVCAIHARAVLECTLGSPMHADAQTIKVIVPEYALFVLVIGSIGDGVVH